MSVSLKRSLKINIPSTTQNEKDILERNHRQSWENHFDQNGNCKNGFNCNVTNWPTP